MVFEKYPASAVILAGGKSSRLGFDKQLLRVKERYLLDMLLEILGGVFQELILVSNTPELHQERNCITVPDTLAGKGPLGGLHAGLMAASYPLCYLTACDMPWIDTGYIRFLMHCHQAHPEAEAVVTRFRDMLEPMNGLYATATAPRIELLLNQGARRMAALLDASRTVYVPEAAARRFSPDWRMFDNINTPADWERYTQQLLEEGPYDKTDFRHAIDS